MPRAILLAFAIVSCAPRRAPPVIAARARPLAVGDLIEQHQHFDVREFLPGPDPDKVGTIWRITLITRDCFSVTLVSGRYRWIGDEPDKLPGHEATFCATERYRATYPQRHGSMQLYEEFRRVAPR